ncbi:MAG: hypothetical protein M3Y71_05920 [Actinomycetota bacterium]|nr:hypothetical protein [Actinomycetota bacterium]
MSAIDLTLLVDERRWVNLRSCVTEALEVVDPVAFVNRVGFPRTSAVDLRTSMRAQRNLQRSLELNDLRLAAACVDVACELVDDWEFVTRVGFDKADAARLAWLLREAAAS